MKPIKVWQPHVAQVRRALRAEIDDALVRYPSVPRRTLVAAMAVSPHDTALDIADTIAKLADAHAVAHARALAAEKSITRRFLRFCRKLVRR